MVTARDYRNLLSVEDRLVDAGIEDVIMRELLVEPRGQIAKMTKHISSRVFDALVGATGAGEHDEAERLIRERVLGCLALMDAFERDELSPELMLAYAIQRVATAETRASLVR